MTEDVGPVEITTSVHWRDEFGRFARAIDTAGDRATLEAANKGAFLAAAFAPKRSLKLAGSIQSFIIAAGQGGWMAGSGHALPQEHGARPHPIDSHDGGPLANKETGFYAPSGHVDHPGNPATHFMLRAFEIVQADMKKILRRNMAA